MGIRKAVLRTAIGGVVLSTCLSAGSALAQAAQQDATLTLTQVTDQDLDVTSSTFIRFGATADYVIDVTNTGPNFATGLALSKVSLPAAPADTSTLKVSAVTGATCKADSTGHIPVAADGTILGVDADGKATSKPAPCPIVDSLTNDPGFEFTAWAPETAYDKGAVVKNGDFFFTAATTGTSGSLPSPLPTPPSIPGPTPGALVDGTVTWVLTSPANAVELTITVEWALPDPDAKGKVILPVNNACPASDSMKEVGVEISTTSAPTTTSASFPGMAVKPWADVEATLDGPTNGAVGQDAVFTHTVTNHGPCTATNVIASFFPNINISTIITFVAGSGTGKCASVDPIADGACPLDDIPAKGVVTWTDTFKIGSLPGDVIQTTIPYEFDANSYATGKEPPFSSKKIGVWDPDTNNNDATGGIRVGKEAGGCSSGGPGGLVAVALMAAAGLLARRRRTA